MLTLVVMGLVVLAVVVVFMQPGESSDAGTSGESSIEPVGAALEHVSTPPRARGAEETADAEAEAVE